MPNSAAIMLGLLLAACAIGFNTMRYPVVWDMVNPARDNASAPAVEASTPPPPQSPLEPEPPVSQPAKAIELTSSSEAADKVIADVQGPVGASANADGTVAARTDVTNTEPETRTPLVPVAPVSSSNVPGTPGNAAVGDAGIRRLPPVNPSGPKLADGNAQTLGSSIPFYPTTGVQ